MESKVVLYSSLLLHYLCIAHPWQLRLSGPCFLIAQDTQLAAEAQNERILRFSGFGQYQVPAISVCLHPIPSPVSRLILSAKVVFSSISILSESKLERERGRVCCTRNVLFRRPGASDENPGILSTFQQIPAQGPAIVLSDCFHGPMKVFFAHQQSKSRLVEEYFLLPRHSVLILILQSSENSRKRSSLVRLGSH